LPGGHHGQTRAVSVLSRLPTPILVAVGAVGGTAIRWTIETATDASAATLVLNVLGSLLLGWLAAVAHSTPGWFLAGVGFAGGFTTFSTFAVDVARRLDGGDSAGGVGLLVLTVSLTVVGAAVGFKVGEQA
jgi:CrcB protein